MHFKLVVHITEDPFDIKRLLDKFTKFLAGWEPADVNLRKASCGFCWWLVNVLFGQDKMYLETGFEKFARVHILEL
jgi:hypothetical protein